MELHVRHETTLDSYPLFFDDEGQTVAWLGAQQERASLRLRSEQACNGFAYSAGVHLTP